jgi:alanine transaminase
MGNPHACGQCPITYYRQILALCELPPAYGVYHPNAQKMFPTDVISKAKEYHAIIEPLGGMGAYTEPQGIQAFREHVSSFIKARDGYPSYPKNIFLTNGASNAIQIVLTALIASEKDAIMTPGYQYPLYSSLISLLGGNQVCYELDEEDKGWIVTKESLERSYTSAVSRGLVIKAMSIINPGNPIGYCFDRSSLEIICEFCANRKIMLLADEVYQQNIYNGKEFISAKKVCCEIPACDNQLELISFHSTSKGIMSECGKRGGYMELCNISPFFHQQLVKLVSETSPCANTSGQIMTSLLANPPLPSDKSYAKFQKEKSNVLDSIASRMTSLVNGLNKINGITCQPVEGSLYAFPSVKLPQRSIKAAKATGEAPDAFYCLSLLEKTGMCVVLASNFGGIPGTNRFGFRITCLFSDDKITEVIEGIAKHHEEFYQLYTSCNCPRESLPPSKPKLKCLDHYTLICENAEQVAEFHIEYLGFRFLRTVDVNTGTVDKNNIDMKNYVLEPPGNPHMSVVITEGLNDDTIFRKYMKRYGAGIHHVAFEVDDVEGAFQYLRANGVRTTSDSVTTDMLSGLKQFFIDPAHAGFYIELIERPSDSESSDEIVNSMESEEERKHTSYEKTRTDHSFFTKGNMSDLANTMHSMLLEDDGPSIADDMTRLVSTPSVLSKTKQLDIGPIQLVGFSVENPKDAMKFLLDSFNFRFVRHDSSSGRIYLRAYDTEHEFLMFIEEALSQDEQRSALVNFSVSEVQLHQHIGQGVLLELQKAYTTYRVNLCSEQLVSSSSCIVDCCSSPNQLSVHINLSQESVLCFLMEPSNLPKWTGHKAIRYLKHKGQWVETRLNKAGKLIDFALHIERSGNDVEVFWPERELSIIFATKGTSIGSTEMVLSLPSSASASASLRSTSQLRRIIELELNLLKAILEDNIVCIPDHFFSQIHLHHLEIYGLKAEVEIDATLFQQGGFQGEIVVKGKLFDLMSTDFALTVRTIPLAILRPANLQDIKIGIRLAKELGVPFVVRGSQVSHSAGGQAQSKGILLDISTFNSIKVCQHQFQDDRSIKVGAGAMWNDVIQHTLDRGLMPPVVNDYQFLSVGGTISVGGVGFMSHMQGIQASHVKEVDVVTGIGDLMKASPDVNRDLFDLVRGGLGQFGVVTSLTIPLIEAPSRILTLKAFYSQKNGAQYFINEVKHLIEAENVDMLHAFLKPSTKDCIASVVGNDAYSSSSDEFKNSIDQGGECGELVYYLELGVYEYVSSDDDDSSASTRKTDQDSIDSLKKTLSGLNIIGGVYFEENHDFMSYLRREPPVIETNKVHGSVPHPSFATILSEEATTSLLKTHIGSPDRGEDGMNEILIMPVRGNAKLKKGQPTPMFPLPTKGSSSSSELSFFLLFLGSAVPKDQQLTVQESIEKIRNHHRNLYEHSKSMGGKRYSYDTLTSEQSEDEWKDHYGEETWGCIIEGKRKFDPYHIFRSSGIHFFN